MNSSTYRFVLDLHSTQSQISLPVLIGDTSRTLRINLSDGCSPYIIEDGCLAKLSIKRPTGTHLEEFCTIENNTTIVYPFSKNENTCAVEGIHNCDVILYGLDGRVIGSPRFTMVVSERAIAFDDITLADEDFTAVDAMMKEEASRQVAEQRRAVAEQRRAEAEEERVTAGEVALQAVSNAKAEADRSNREANRSASEADRSLTAANRASIEAAVSATKAAEEEVTRLVGELGIVQTTGDSETAVMSQAATTIEFDKLSEENDVQNSILSQIVHIPPINITEIPDVTMLTGINSYPNPNPDYTGIILYPLNAFDSYWWVADRHCDVYFGDAVPNYLSITVARGYVEEAVNIEGNTILVCEENGVRRRTEDTNLPTKTNRMSISPGDAVAITVTHGASVYLYGYDKNPVVAPTEEFRAQIVGERKRYIKYGTSNNGEFGEYLSIYIPTYTGYIRYDVVHNIMHEINSNIWRVDMAYMCDETLSNAVAITVGGEWELAVKLLNRPDFSGGKFHGDEIMESIKFYLNGKEIDITTLAEPTEFDAFSFVQTSQLFDPNDGMTLIAEHGSEHIFNDKLTINQSLVWKVNEQLSSCYMAMFPISKSYSNRFFTDADYKTREMTGEETSVQDAKIANIQSDNGLSAVFAVNKYPFGFGRDRFLTTDNTVNQTGAYNKCYYEITPVGGAKSCAVGELWKSQTIYNIQY